MDENNKKDHPEGCRCMGCQGHGWMSGSGMCGYGCGRRHWFLRAIFGIIVLGFVFSAGVKLGELKGYLEGGYGTSMMRGGWSNLPSYMMGGEYGRGMMNQGYYYATSTVR